MTHTDQFWRAVRRSFSAILAGATLAMPTHLIALEDPDFSGITDEYPSYANDLPYGDPLVGSVQPQDGDDVASSPASSQANGTRAQVTQPMLQLEPHCTETDRTKCPVYNVLDASTLTTASMTLGDILDIDVVVASPNPGEIATVRAWLQYDPTALEARVIEITDTFSQPIPGEEDIDMSRGLVKIGAGAPAGSITQKETAVARVSFRVITSMQSTTIRFANFLADGRGETTIRNASDQSVLTVEPSALRVSISSGSTENPTNTPLPYSPPPVTNGGDQNGNQPVTGGESFGILQVQGVRVTSQGDSLFIGWIPLQAASLAGYNVYYGTVSGRYIQRRSLPATETSLAIRGLENGVQYFVAVRGFTADGAETAFSEEASVVIGRPETSTSPLAQPGLNEPTVSGNPVDTHGGNHVVGETGMSETLVALLLVAAVAGTALAWRRQLTLAPHDTDGR